MLLTFLGHSAWGLEASGERVLIDPYPVDDSARGAITAFGDTSDLVLVSHGAGDHQGIAVDVVLANPRSTLITEPAMVRHARERGVPEDRALVLAWNGERVLGDWHVRAIEVRHASVFAGAGGELLSGLPLGFVVWHESEPEVRVAHLGDTSLFSDMQLIGRLYRPTVALLGVGAARGFFAEMSPQEGALAAMWLGVEAAFPMHWEADAAAATQFCEAVRHLPCQVRTWVPELGQVIEVTRQTRVAARR